MIQVLTYSGRETSFKEKEFTLNSLHDAQSLDEFDVNIIDLSDENFWRRSNGNIGAINKIADFKSMSDMLANSVKAKNIILLPQNEMFCFEYLPSEKKFYRKCELKNMIPSMKEDSLHEIYEPAAYIDIVYENTKTRVEGHTLSAAFHFNGVTQGILTKSEKSDKVTTMSWEKVVLSTLKINNHEELVAFLRTIGLINDRQELPGWIEEVKMFDDEKQLEIIQENEQLISHHQQQINKAKDVLNRNQRYKTILYTNGDELVEVVFEILKEMLGCDLSQFEDEKKEDFNIRMGDKVFIGEIKGVTPNVKKANVSQLDVHVQEYLDNHEEEQETITALLIINHQRNKPLHERENIPDEQIRLAERNGSLIVETITLLKLFEKYMSGEKDREECIDLLKDNVGLLQI